jgi:hypothetical protein
MASKLKKMVLARMAKTGESWQTAIQHVRASAALTTPTLLNGAASTEYAPLPGLVGALFTSAVLARLARITRTDVSPMDHAGAPARRRQELFSSSAKLNPGMKRLQTAWRAYILHAMSIGIADPDLRGRLTSDDDDDFRGALAECRVAWFFHKKLGVALRRARASGRGRIYDFEADSGLCVEVKAPHIPIVGNHWSGDDSAALRACVEEAGGQFKKGNANLVAIVPLLRTPLWMERNQLTTALIGQWALSVPVRLDPHAPIEEPSDVFLQNGHLTRAIRTDKGTKTLWTRIAGVATLEERTAWRGEKVVMRHPFHVVHNPFATAPGLDSSIFGSHPQLAVREGDQMGWSDGASTFG